MSSACAAPLRKDTPGISICRAAFGRVLLGVEGGLVHERTTT
jgi:hypothetical protein